MAQISAKAPQANASQGHHTSRVLARRETISAYLFMLPSLLFFVGFVLVPMGMCLTSGHRGSRA